MLFFCIWVTLPNLHSSHEKTTICIYENKDADQAVTAQLISAFVFAIRIILFLFCIYPMFQASSFMLSLYSLVCVRPGRNPNCWFSHAQAHFYFLIVVLLSTLLGVQLPACVVSFPGCSYHMIRDVRKPVFRVSTRSDTNQAVQSQKMTRILKFGI